VRPAPASSSAEPQPAAAPPARANLVGIVEGMRTYGMGEDAQRNWDLDHKPLCLPGCPGYKSTRKCDAACEHGIIRKAKKQKTTRKL
jgi:hypothetical protein